MHALSLQDLHTQFEFVLCVVWCRMEVSVCTNSGSLVSDTCTAVQTPCTSIVHRQAAVQQRILA